MNGVTSYNHAEVGRHEKSQVHSTKTDDQLLSDSAATMGQGHDTPRISKPQSVINQGDLPVINNENESTNPQNCPTPLTTSNSKENEGTTVAGLQNAKTRKSTPQASQQQHKMISSKSVNNFPKISANYDRPNRQIIQPSQDPQLPPTSTLHHDASNKISQPAVTKAQIRRTPNISEPSPYNDSFLCYENQGQI